MEQTPTVETLDLEGQTLSIKKGLTDSQIDQLIEYSTTDPDLKKFTSDPVRFKDRAGFDEFSKHILAYYVLTDEDENLLGVIWFDDLSMYVIPENNVSQGSSLDSGPQTVRNDMGDYGISFAIRLYGQARGKGLAVPFSEKAFEDFKTSEEYLNHPHQKFWLAVSPENQAAVAVYKKLGFKDHDYNKEFNKNLMIL